MKHTVINMSHPLTASQVQMIKERLGVQDLAIVDIPAQVNTFVSLADEVDRLVTDVFDQSWPDDAHFILRPMGLSDVNTAFFVQFQRVCEQIGMHLSLLVMRRLGTAIPPLFEVWDIVAV